MRFKMAKKNAQCPHFEMQNDKRSKMTRHTKIRHILPKRDNAFPDPK